MAAGPVSYGQQWTIEAGARANAAFSGASVYISDLTVYHFHRWSGAALDPLQYDVSVDGGQTFPTMRATAAATMAHVISARLTASPSGGVRVLLLLNDAICIAYSDTVFTLPTSSTWTILQPAGNASAPGGYEVRGVNAVLAGSLGGLVRVWSSLDGGATWTISASTPFGATGADAVGMQVFASPVDGTWCFLNPSNGKIHRSTDSGVTWGAAVKTITEGNAAVPQSGAIWAVNATRMVACFKGQVVTSDDAGLTWTDRQNLTLNPPSTTSINQGAIGWFAAFGQNVGVEVLGGVTVYPHQFNGATTRGAMWRSVDLGTTWTLVDCVGGSNIAGSSELLTAFVARAGRGVMDMWDSGNTTRHSWFNPNPAAIGGIPATCGAAIVADPCPEPEEA